MYEIVNGILVRWDYKNTGRTVIIWNPKFNWTINEEEDYFCVRQICCGSGLILCESDSSNRGTRIVVWKMGNPPTLLRTRTFELKSAHCPVTILGSLLLLFVLKISLFKYCE